MATRQSETALPATISDLPTRRADKGDKPLQPATRAFLAKVHNAGLGDTCLDLACFPQRIRSTALRAGLVLAIWERGDWRYRITARGIRRLTRS